MAPTSAPQRQISTRLGPRRYGDAFARATRTTQTKAADTLQFSGSLSNSSRDRLGGHEAKAGNARKNGIVRCYRCIYAPDNASSLCAADSKFASAAHTRHDCRSRGARMKGATYRTLNPAGKIPALETPRGVIFETAAILLWLEETHAGNAPAPGAPGRGDFLKWLFFTANTLHADLRLVFYPQDSVGEDGALQANLHAHVTKRLCRHYTILDEAAGAGHAFFNGPGPDGARFLHRLVHALVGALRAWRDRLVLAWRLSQPASACPAAGGLAGSAVSCRCRGARSDTVLGAATMRSAGGERRLKDWLVRVCEIAIRLSEAPRGRIGP